MTLIWIILLLAITSASQMCVATSESEKHRRRFLAVDTQAIASTKKMTSRPSKQAHAPAMKPSRKKKKKKKSILTVLPQSHSNVPSSFPLSPSKSPSPSTITAKPTDWQRDFESKGEESSQGQEEIFTLEGGVPGGISGAKVMKSSEKMNIVFFTVTIITACSWFEMML